MSQVRHSLRPRYWSDRNVKLIVYLLPFLQRVESWTRQVCRFHATCKPFHRSTRIRKDFEMSCNVRFPESILYWQLANHLSATVRSKCSNCCPPRVMISIHCPITARHCFSKAFSCFWDTFDPCCGSALQSASICSNAIFCTRELRTVISINMHTIWNFLSHLQCTLAPHDNAVQWAAFSWRRLLDVDGRIRYMINSARNTWGCCVRHGRLMLKSQQRRFFDSHTSLRHCWSTFSIFRSNGKGELKIAVKHFPCVLSSYTAWGVLGFSISSLYQAKQSLQEVQNMSFSSCSSLAAIEFAVPIAAHVICFKSHLEVL